MGFPTQTFHLRHIHHTHTTHFIMSAMTAFVAVAPKVVKTTEAKAAPAPAKAYVGLKPATLFNKAAAPEFTVSNGTTTTAVFKVWTPINNKFFETLSYLPSLSDAEIAKQVNYIIAKRRNPFFCHLRILLQPILANVEAAYVRMHRPKPSVGRDCLLQASLPWRLHPCVWVLRRQAVPNDLHVGPPSSWFGSDPC